MTDSSRPLSSQSLELEPFDQRKVEPSSNDKPGHSSTFEKLITNNNLSSNDNASINQAEILASIYKYKGIMALISYRIDLCVDYFNKSFAIRLLYFCFMLLSIGLAVWSYQYRYADIIQQDEILDNIQQEREKLDTLLSDLSWEDRIELEQHVKKAEERIFQDYHALAQWLLEQTQQAQDLNYSFNYTIAGDSPSQIKGVSIVSIDANLSTTPDNAGLSAYQDSLNVLKSWIDGDIYLQVVELSVKSSGDGIENMNVKINVWVNHRSQNNE